MQLRNQNPFVAIHGLPSIGVARTLPAGRSEAAITLDLTNEFADSTKPDESIELDGETHRLALSYRRGFGRGLEAGVSLPVVRHSGGFLDGFIESWHDMLGLSDLGRDDVPEDRLVYRYTRSGEALAEVTDSTAGLGDITLSGGFSPTFGRDASAMQFAVRAQLKLPTGDSDRLRGSGAVDVAVWGVVSGKLSSWRGSQWRWYGGAGVLAMGNGDVLPGQQRDFGVFANAGAAWQPLSRIAFKLQLDAHSALYEDTRVSPLAEDAFTAGLGGTWSVSSGHSLDFAVVEDVINLGASPDVSFHLNWRAGF
ncbi:MAG: DUF3187 family protein [Gammaproteobacteria bacterium]|nr:DUF3187 family protein [Gammaproteobacteria bacterium]